MFEYGFYKNIDKIISEGLNKLNMYYYPLSEDSLVANEEEIYIRGNYNCNDDILKTHYEKCIVING